MKKLVALVATMILAVGGVAQASIATVDLTVLPASKTVNVGDNFSLEIWAEVVNFGPGDFWQKASVGLEFDPTYLQLDSATINNSQFSLGMFAGGGNNDWAAGYAWFNVGLGGNITSDTRLATLDFTALAVVDLTQLDIADYLRDAVNPTQVYAVFPVAGAPPNLIFYNLGDTYYNLGKTYSPVGNRGLGEITVIPEPATLIIWSLLGAGAAGLGVWRRRRWGATGAHWTEENRQAIRQIVDRGRLNG